eukprot:jgi/Mesvir1/22251/Mv14385-RA.1
MATFSVVLRGANYIATGLVSASSPAWSDNGRRVCSRIAPGSSRRCSNDGVVHIPRRINSADWSDCRVRLLRCGRDVVGSRNRTCCVGVRAEVGRSAESFVPPRVKTERPDSRSLHSMLAQRGIDVTFAKEARELFCDGVNILREDAATKLRPDVAGDCIMDEDACCYLDTLVLARVALNIGAEDDALVTHSPVALPVESYLGRLTAMAEEICAHHLPCIAEDERRGENGRCVDGRASPQDVLNAVSNYLYDFMGFKASSLGTERRDVNDYYLHSALTRRKGSPATLAIIYSEIVRLIYQKGMIDFTVEMDNTALPTPNPAPATPPSESRNPEDASSLPGDESPASTATVSTSGGCSFPGMVAQPRVMRAGDGGGGADADAVARQRRGNLLVLLWRALTASSEANRATATPMDMLGDMLRSLKRAYWPWQGEDPLPGVAGALAAPGSQQLMSSVYNEGHLFVAAAKAACSGVAADGQTSDTSGMAVAAARASQWRMNRGIWTSQGGGDMRRCIAACERLIYLFDEPRDKRDLGVLFYHCGLYKEALEQLNAYQQSQVLVQAINFAGSWGTAEETEALYPLMQRLQLVVAESSMGLTGTDAAPSEMAEFPEPW